MKISYSKRGNYYRLITWKTIYTETKFNSVESIVILIFTWYAPISTCCFQSIRVNIALEDVQPLDLRWYLTMESNVDKSIYVVSTPYSNTSMKSIQFTRVSFVIQTTFSYISVKLQLTVRQTSSCFCSIILCPFRPIYKFYHGL